MPAGHYARRPVGQYVHPSSQPCVHSCPPCLPPFILSLEARGLPPCILSLEARGLHLTASLHSLPGSAGPASDPHYCPPSLPPLPARYVILPRDFEKGYKANVKKGDHEFAFYQ